MRRCLLISAAITVIAGLCMSASAQRKPDSSEYDKLDPAKLSQVLTDMDMTELLHTLVDEQGSQDSPEAKMQLAQLKINEAEQKTSIEERNKMLDEAISLLQDAAKIIQDQADKLSKAVEDEENYTPAVVEADKAVLESFKARFRVLEVMGLSRTERYAARLIFLRGGDADRKAILTLTEEVVKPLRDLNADIEDTRDHWSRSQTHSEREMVVMPKLMDIQRRVSYRSAWMNYYRGLAMTGSEEEKARKGFFYDAQSKVDQFARGSDEFGVKYWAQILFGMASRELGQYDIAEEFFNKTMSKAAPDEIRARALFELAETRISQAKDLYGSEGSAAAKVAKAFGKAREAIDDYSKKADELLGKAYEAEIALNAAMLGNYLYETWAGCTKSSEEAEKLREDAQNSLMGFLDKFDSPDIRGAFFQIIANKYRDREDYDKLNSMILLAIAEDKTAKEKPTAEELDLGEKLLKIVLDRKVEKESKVSGEIRSQAMFSLALIYAHRLMTRDAGEKFLEFAEKYPDDPLAKLAAYNAVQSYSALVSDLVDDNKPVPSELRERFIVTMEKLLDKWGSEPEYSEWYFHLGWQNQKLADTIEDDKERTECIKKAIAAYDKVPADSAYALDAEYWSLGLRRTLMGDKAEPADARRLFDELQRYSAKAREQAAAAEADGKDTRAGDLMEWGAECAFMAQEIRYSLLGEKEEARTELRKLGKQWPGTAILKRAAEFEIMRLFAEGNTEEVSRAIREFQAQYPKEAPELVQMLIRHIRASIDKNRNNSDMAAELQNDRKKYIEFAKGEYERVLKENLSAEDLYYFKQMYADALVESANLEGNVAAADQGLALFNELTAYRDARRQERAAAVDKVYAKKLEDIELVSSNPQKVMAYKDEYFKILGDELGINKDEVVTAVKLQAAVKFYEEAEDDTQRQERLKNVVDRLVEAYKRLREIEKGSLPVDAGNYIGFARAYRLKKEYVKSVEYYQKLIAGLNLNSNPKEYWNLNLEMCQCVLEANSNNKDGLRGLLDYIKSLKARDDNMGGLNNKFNSVRSQAEDLLK